MDPALKAAQELSALFERLGVPCEVRVSASDGKYAVATRDLPEKGFTLVEETPLVSWPTRCFLRMKLPFCFHCLRRHQGNRAERDGAPSAADGIQWSTCELCQSQFCSHACRTASRRTHLLLCSGLTSLRAEEAAAEEEGGKEKKKDEGEPKSRETKEERWPDAAPLHAAATHTIPTTTTASTAAPHEAAVEGSITPESLARCAAGLLARIAAAMEGQKITHEELSGREGAGLVRQLFTQAATPFDRLIGAPDNADFAGVRDPAVWFQRVRDVMQGRAVRLLTLTAAAAATGASSSSSPTSPSAAPPPAWAREMVEAALSDTTLRTFLGQIALNAYAVNDYVLLESEKEGSGARPTTPKTDGVREGAGEVPDQAMGTGTAPQPANTPGHRGGIRFAWVMKGAAVYSLLATFNHSCEPNTAVTHVGGTHEIAITTTKPVAKGEQLHITYIPLHEDSTAEERRGQLKDYFFTCHCPRCEREDKLAAAS